MRHYLLLRLLFDLEIYIANFNSKLSSTIKPVQYKSDVMELLGLSYQRILLMIVLVAIFNAVLLTFYYKSLESYFRNTFKRERALDSGEKYNKWDRLKSLDHNSMFIELALVSGSSGFLNPFFEAMVTSLYEGPYLWWVFGIVVSAFMVGYYLIVKKAIKPIMMRSIRSS